MARPGVSYLDVANAAQQLIASEKNLTIENIRMILGTGSNSTLGNHLRTWKSQQNQTQQIASTENLPEALIAALKGVWEQAVNLTDAKIQTIQEQAERESAQLTQQIQSLQKETQEWQQRHQQTKEERDKLSEEKLVLEQLLTHTKMEVVGLTEKYSGLEQQNQQQTERINELHRQNEQIQTNLEHYRDLSLEQRLADQTRHEQQLQQLEYTIQQLNHQLTELIDSNELLKQQSFHQNAENKNLHAQLAKLETQYASLTAQLTETLGELGKKTQAQQHWYEQFNHIQTKHDEQNIAFIEMQTKHAVLTKQLETLQNDYANITEHNKVLSHDKWLLAQEKAQIQGQLISSNKILNKKGVSV